MGQIVSGFLFLVWGVLVMVAAAHIRSNPKLAMLLAWMGMMVMLLSGLYLWTLA